MIPTMLTPGPWSHDALTPPMLFAVVEGWAKTQQIAQGIIDRRVAIAAYREERTDGKPGRFAWRLSLTPLGKQLRGLEVARHNLARIAYATTKAGRPPIRSRYSREHDYAAKDSAIDGSGTP